YAVLTYLVEHAGRLARTRDLLEAVWPEGFIGDGALKVYISELRRALGDRPEAPRYIETLRGRGYRFLTTVWEHPPRTDGAAVADGSLFGREAACEQLRITLQRALAGTRQVVFITGGAGVGKTAVVDAFLRSAARQRD